MPLAPSREVDEGRLRAALDGQSFPSRLVFRAQTSSTQDVAREFAEIGATPNLLVVAGGQTAGRGRLGRSWHSASGLGVYLSLLMRTRQTPRSLVWWTLAAAVAACDACRLRSTGISLKWPNDLVFQRSKLGGVLAESRSVGDTLDYVILGIGLNLFHGPGDFPSDLETPATSLSQIVPADLIDATQIVVDTVQELGRRLAELEGSGAGAIARAWEDRAPGSRGQRVRVRDAETASWVEGVSDGLDDDASLRVRLDQGPILRVRLVDSVRPFVAGPA